MTDAKPHTVGGEKIDLTVAGNRMFRIGGTAADGVQNGDLAFIDPTAFPCVVRCSRIAPQSAVSEQRINMFIKAVYAELLEFVPFLAVCVAAPQQGDTADMEAFLRAWLNQENI